MTLVYSFLFCGLVCLLGQIILDNTNLTPGHVTSGFVVIGTILSFFNCYDKIAGIVGAGANIPIVSFGNVLLNAAYAGYNQMGPIGLLGNMLSGVGVGVTAAIISAFIVCLFAKAKD